MLKLEDYIKDNLDLICSYIGILISLTIIILSYTFHIQQQHIGITIFLSCVIYIIIKNKLNIHNKLNFKITKDLLKVNNIFYVIIFCLSIVLLYMSLYERSLSYYILILLLSVSILIDIIYVNTIRHTIIPLFKIILLIFNIQLGIYYEYPGPLGLDTWLHLSWINKWSYAGHITPIDAFSNNINALNQYFYSPIFHILVIVIQLFSSLNLHESYLIIGVTTVLSIIFIYLLILKLLKNNLNVQRVSLLSLLLIGVNPYFLHYITEIMPMTLGFTFFLILLYLIFTNKNFLVLLIISTAIIFTNGIASFIVLLLFIVYSIILLLNYYITKKGIAYSNILITILFIIILTTQWMRNYINTDSLFEVLTDSLLSAIMHYARLGNTVNVSIPSLTINFIFNVFFWLMLLSIGLLGALYWLSKNKLSSKKIILLVYMIILILFTYGFPLFGLQNIVPSRWFLFICAIMVIPASDVLLVFMQNITNENIKIILPIILIVTYVFFSITSNVSSSNDPLWVSNGDRVSFRSSELMAVDTMKEFIANNNITIDYMNVPAYIVLAYASDENVNYIKINNSNYTGLVIIRNSIFTDGLYVQKSFGISDGPYELNESHFNSIYNINYNCIYSNGQVWAYASK